MIYLCSTHLAICTVSILLNTRCVILEFTVFVVVKKLDGIKNRYCGLTKLFSYCSALRSLGYNLPKNKILLLEIYMLKGCCQTSDHCTHLSMSSCEEKQDYINQLLNNFRQIAIVICYI